MAGKDGIVIINQKRVGKAKPPDAVGDLPDPLSGVDANAFMGTAIPGLSFERASRRFSSQWTM
jgi:hypothetical protein